jgi:TPR repeat protein
MTLSMSVAFAARAAIVLVGFFMASVSPTKADFSAAERALAAGNLERTHDELVPLVEMGDARAQNLLAVFYQNGWIVDRDPVKAAELYRMAGDQELSRALHNLGRLYRAGLGVPQDPSMAADLWKQAGRMGFVKSQSALGALYYEGAGVEQDMFRAYFWWSLAARRLEIEATQAREDIIYRLTPHEKEVADALVDRFEADR